MLLIIDYTIPILQIFTLLISVISAYITIRNVNKTVRFQRAQTIVDLLSKLMGIVDPSKVGWENLISGKYVSDEHLLIEKKLSLWLDPKNKHENQLISLVNQLRTDSKNSETLLRLRDQIISEARNITTKQLK